MLACVVARPGAARSNRRHRLTRACWLAYAGSPGVLTGHGLLHCASENLNETLSHLR